MTAAFPVSLLILSTQHPASPQTPLWCLHGPQPPSPTQLLYTRATHIIPTQSLKPDLPDVSMATVSDDLSTDLLAQCVC